MKTAIVDDKSESRNFIAELVNKFFQEKEQEYSVKLYESPMDLLLDLDQGKYFDLYLLDVEMPVINGIQLAREIRKYYFDPFIIYITDHVEYSPEAFEVNAFRYIPKIRLQEKLSEALAMLLSKYDNKKQSSYVIHHYLDTDILQCKNIYYVKKEGKYVIFCHTDGESRERTTFKEVLQQLPQEEFIEIGRGYAVNICHVMCLRKREVYLRNGEVLPASSSHLHLIQERIEAYCRYRPSEK